LHTALVGDAVVATGAGIITTAPARELITREFAIWLDADDDTLIGRVSAGDDRPLLGDDRAEGVRRLRREREKWYRESSRVRVTATGTLDEVLERILAVTKELTP
jgi:shikimate kinase